jgi:hypothetical protein
MDDDGQECQREEERHNKEKHHLPVECVVHTFPTGFIASQGYFLTLFLFTPGLFGARGIKGFWAALPPCIFVWQSQDHSPGLRQRE